MFATFELYRGGWVDAETKPKQIRSCSGCLPCRQRKKKCDEHRPVCNRCSKIKSSECLYPAHEKRPKPARLLQDSEYRAGMTFHGMGESSWPTNSARSPPYLTETAGYESPYSGISSPDLVSSSELTENLFPPCSLSEFFLIFGPSSHALYSGPESCIISLTIPLIVQSAAVFHAMVSCSSIFVSQKQPAWQDVAIRHHCKTLRSLALEIQNRDLDDPTVAASTMAVVMMLHLFQNFDRSSQRPGCAHVLAAQDIFFRTFVRRQSESVLDTLIVEAYIYRIAVNCLFHPELIKTYTYLETLATSSAESSTLQQADSFRRALWLGIPAELFDLIYKISFLRHKMPLKGDQWFEAVAISQRLKSSSLSRPPHTVSEGSQSEADIEAAMYYARHLYTLAAELLVLKVLEPQVNVDDIRIQFILRSALDDIISFDSNTPILIYPVVVLGTAAVDEQDRDLITSQVNRMRLLSGNRGVQNILRFLQASWGKSDEVMGAGTTESMCSTPMQLDIWLTDSYLRSVTI